MCVCVDNDGDNNMSNDKMVVKKRVRFTIRLMFKARDVKLCSFNYFFIYYLEF